MLLLKINQTFLVFKREIPVTLQGITDELIEWSRKNRVVLNPDKCKELRISFSRNPEAFDSVSIDDKEIEVVNSAKLLGITISDNLT